MKKKEENSTKSKEEDNTQTVEVSKAKQSEKVEYSKKEGEVTLAITRTNEDAHQIPRFINAAATHVGSWILLIHTRILGRLLTVIRYHIRKRTPKNFKTTLRQKV